MTVVNVDVHNRIEGKSIELVPSLLSIAKTTRALTGLYLADIGLILGQDRVIACLDERKPTSVSSIASNIGVRPPTVSKSLHVLVSRGLAVRNRDPNDARGVQVLLTRAGTQKRREVLAVWKRLESDILREVAADNLEGIRTACVLVDAVLAGAPGIFAGTLTAFSFDQ